MFDDLFAPVITDADPNAFEALQASVSRALRIRHFLALDLAEHVAQLLKERKKSRRWLAQRLGKTDSELSKWLSGTHNLTLDSIAKLSDALDEDLLVSTRFPMGFFGSSSVSVPASTTTTSFDKTGGSLARRNERFTARPVAQVLAGQAGVPSKVLADLLTTPKPGDYSYAMAA